MGQYNQAMQGENVFISYFNGSQGSSTSTMSLFDANWKPRVLQSFERLIVDDLWGGPSSSGQLYITDLPSGQAIGSLASSTILAQAVGGFANLEITAKEGISMPVGVIPSVILSGSAQIVCVQGTGRIVEGSTQGVRPNWQATTNSSGLS